MSESYSREQRAVLQASLKHGGDLQCPACGAVMTRQRVVPAANVPYVRHRIWLVCTGCKRSVSLDER